MTGLAANARHVGRREMSIMTGRTTVKAAQDVEQQKKTHTSGLVVNAVLVVRREIMTIVEIV